MAIEELAKKYSNAVPGSKLVKYHEIAIPQYCMEMVLIMEKEKPLSVLQEFVLKFLSEGIYDIQAISRFLGINISAINNAVADMQSLQLISTDINNLTIKFTDKGQEALRGLKTIKPEEIDYRLFMDGFTGDIYIDNLQKYKKKELKGFDLFAIPPLLQKPNMQDIAYDKVKSAITKFRNNNYYAKDKLEGKLLGISSLEKVYTEYNKASVLIYCNNNGELDLRVFRKATRMPEYENVLLQMHNQHHTKIFEFDMRDEVDEAQDTPYYDLISPEIKEDAYAYSGRASELDREIELLNSQLSEMTVQNVQYHDEETQRQIDEIKKEIEERIEEREGATRILSTYDHRPLLIRALEDAVKTVIIVSPWIKKGGMNGEILNLIRQAVNRGVYVVIGYGISEKHDSDDNVLKELNEISAKKWKGKLDIIALNNTHEKVLIMDSTFLVVTSFNWLSFAGDPEKGFRQETGIYTEAIESIEAMKADLGNRMNKQFWY